MKRLRLYTSVPAWALLALPVAAHAYGGPGSVLTGFGALLAFGAALVVAILGFFWYPVKRLVKWLSGSRSGAGDVEAGG